MPVLLAEVLDGLALQIGATVVDGTLGGGGHSRAIAERVGLRGRVVALDRDPQVVERAGAHLPRNVTVRHASFTELETVLDDLGIQTIDAMLLDLGLSSDQLEDDSRGFSFRSSGPLDLRFDPTQGEPAWELLSRLREKELADLIYKYGEERASRAIARRIVQTRQHDPIRTAAELAALVRSCVRRSRHHSIDPATRTFQALRIAVNQELDSLQSILELLPRRLRPGGRLAVISFHSLEDRLVKQAFRERELWQPVTKKPILAGETERALNPRSRSAKLRIAVVGGNSP